MPSQPLSHILYINDPLGLKCMLEALDSKSARTMGRALCSLTAIRAIYFLFQVILRHTHWPVAQKQSEACLGSPSQGDVGFLGRELD